MSTVAFKGKPIHLEGRFPLVGHICPEFILVDKDLNDRHLKDFDGKRKVISIVPSLDTAVCSLSTKKFHEALKDHQEIVVIVVSADLPFAQSRFCSNDGVKNVVTLSMMRSKDFAKDFGVLIQDSPLAGLCTRAVIVLDKNNKILYTELVKEITQEPNYEKALEALLK